MTVRDNGLRQLTNLTCLDIANNGIISDKGIETLTRLESLNLRNNDTITSHGIRALTNLRNMTISGTYKFDGLIPNLRSLTVYNSYLHPTNSTPIVPPGCRVGYSIYTGQDWQEK